jgi:hypothetical protein
MVKYITYLNLIFHSRGASPIDVLKIMKGLGWKPLFGNYDFSYEWDIDFTENDETFQEYCEHINILHNRLENLNISYTLRTFQHGNKEKSTKLKQQ